MFEHSRVFHVQTYQLAEAIHDSLTCPFSHRNTSQKYIPREDCPRLPHLREFAYDILQKADGIEFKPFTNGTKVYEQPTLDI